MHLKNVQHYLKWKKAHIKSDNEENYGRHREKVESAEQMNGESCCTLGAWLVVEGGGG